MTYSNTAVMLLQISVEGQYLLNSIKKLLNTTFAFNGTYVRQNKIIYLRNGTIWYTSHTEQAIGPEIFQKLQATSKF
jgi:hypothetical protein